MIKNASAQDVVHTRVKLETEAGVVRLQVELAFVATWTVIFGPSGSGKSSLLRAMCGLPAGTDRDEAGDPTYLRGIAYAPQGTSLFPHLTVRENVEFASKVRKLDSKKVVDDALALFEIEALTARMPRQLSGGERQRVSLARAFAVPQAKLMLLDEPFTGVGRAQRDRLLMRMRETMAEREVPVISVTHDIEEAFLLEAEVVRLEAGRVTAQGAAALVLAEEREEMLRSLRA